MSKAKKLAAKLPDLVEQEHGGALLTGGVPGHDGSNAGRPSKDFIARCIEAGEDEDLWKEARKKNPVSILELAARYTKSLPAQQHKISGRVEFVKARETRRK